MKKTSKAGATFVLLISTRHFAHLITTLGLFTRSLIFTKQGDYRISFFPAAKDFLIFHQYNRINYNFNGYITFTLLRIVSFFWLFKIENSERVYVTLSICFLVQLAFSVFEKLMYIILEADPILYQNLSNGLEDEENK